MELTITETNDTFESWIAKDFVPDNLKEILSKATILIVPFENLRDTPKPLFPVGTENILRYFENSLPQGQSIDICIADEDYQEFVFNSNYKRLGNFILASVAIPFFINVFSSYVYDKFIKEDNSKPQIQVIDKSTHTTINNHISTITEKKYLEPTHIKFTVTVVDTTGTSKKISYEGPAADIDNVLKSLKEYEK